MGIIGSVMDLIDIAKFIFRGVRRLYRWWRRRRARFGMVVFERSTFYRGRKLPTYPPPERYPVVETIPDQHAKRKHDKPLAYLRNLLRNLIH